jgi:hypothetical protein
VADWLGIHGSLMTAVANGAWMGLGLFVSLIAHAILRWSWARDLLGIHHDLSHVTRSVLTWVRLPALAHVAHRAYWNIGIIFGPDERTYAAATVEWKHVTILFVLLMIVGTYRTMASLCPPRDRAWLATALAACVLSMSGISGALV